MPHSRKRRSSMSPSRSQQQDKPDHKKRKIIATITNETSSSRVARSRSPVPLASDSSATLDGDSVPPILSPSKDKGKAVERDPLMLELEQLRKEIAQKNELLEKHEKTVASVTQTLTCQICLDLMLMPYALAPCGHVSCHTCLVAWFTASHNDHDGDEQNHEVEWYSDDASSIDENENIPGGFPLVNGAHSVNGNAPGGDGNPPNPDPPNHVAYPNSVHRRKTCPHCRCVVKERPVQVYALKDLVGIVASHRAEAAKEECPKKKDPKDSKKKKDPSEKDPWKGIFRPVGRPAHRDRNGNPWGDNGGDDGHPPWHGFGMDLFANAADIIPGEFFEPEDDEDEDEVEIGHPLFYADPYHPMPQPPHHPPNPIEPPDHPPPPPFIDEEDGVRRCGVCLHEIWGGACTNDTCGVVYNDASEFGSDDVGVAEYDRPHHSGDEDEGGCGIRDPEFDGLGDDEEDGYESSFIDDAEAQRRVRAAQESVEDHSGSEGQSDIDDDFVPGPSRRWMGGGQETIVISSGEDEDGDRALGPSRPNPRGRSRLIIDDEDEDEGGDEAPGSSHVNPPQRLVVDDDDEGEEHEVEADVQSIDGGACETQSGPDGAGSRGSNAVSEFTSWGSLSGHHSQQHEPEEEDDRYELQDTPYIWEEDEEDNEGDDGRDDVVYLYDEDEEDEEDEY